MEKVIRGTRLLAMLVIASAAPPVFANTQSTLPKPTVVAPKYDVANEVMLEGTVQSVMRKPTPGMMFGGHLMVSTAQGTVDAALGRFGLSRPGAASLAPNQHVKLIGLMTTFRNQRVLLTRLIECGNQTIEIRSERGFALLAGAKARRASTWSFGGTR